MSIIIPPAAPQAACPDRRRRGLRSWFHHRCDTTHRALLGELATTRREARTDDVTSLLNRRGFTEAADDVLTAAHHQRRAVIAALVDLDAFKTINDTFGHATGDRVLIETAAALSTFLAPYGVLGRLGGDEYVALLTAPPSVTSPAGWTSWLTARTRIRLAQRTTTLIGQPAGFSVGLAVRWLPHRDPVSPATMLAAADHAMYTAKTSRTTIATYPEHLPLPAPVRDTYPVARLRDSLTGRGVVA